MERVGPETCPLPSDPLLAEVAASLNQAASWGFVVDRSWRLVFMTDELRLSNGGLVELSPIPLDFVFARQSIDLLLAGRGRIFSLETFVAALRALGGWLTSDLPNGDADVHELVDARLRDMVTETVAPAARTSFSFVVPGSYIDAVAPIDITMTATRIRDERGHIVGTSVVSKPAAGMAVLGTMAAAGDLGHFTRMQQVATAARRPSAILFADLEASSPLSRHLSTPSYFALGRRLIRAADQCVIEAGGMVGRHVGDGVVAFFVAETLDSESDAARACISAMRHLRGKVVDVAVRSGLAVDDVVVRFGLHWGSTLYIGQIASAARAEVNALGDEMNEASRIEACATGGRALASKTLMERLEKNDAQALGLDPAGLTYTALGDLATATEKARRDAPLIPVCEL